MIEKLYIDGVWCDSINGKTFEIMNPANGAILGKMQKAESLDAMKAIEAASKALPNWSAKMGKERGLILKKLRDLMSRDREALSKLMVLEQGKSIHEARNEIDYSIGFVEWFSEEAKRIYGDIVPTIRNGQRLFTIKQPIGVIAAITPWNFPIAMVIRKVAPAIAAGCTVVLKPSEETPYTAMAIAKLLEEAGLPKGVLNVVCGDAQTIGDELTSSSKVRLLTFTGSTSIGKVLMEKCSKTVKKVTLELGGNAPFIVFEDADIDKAVEGLTASKLRNGGQSCICANRIFIHKNIIEAFTSKLKEKFSQIKVGDGLNEENNLGAMINRAAVKKISSLIQDSVSHGGEILYQGRIENDKGCFIQPTIIINKNLESQIHNSEIFGPVVSIIPFNTEEEVVDKANATQYGLASYFYTEDRNRIWRVLEKLEYGLVGINDVVLSSEMASFGGIKESGIGREGGRHGIEEFLEDKFFAMS